MNFTQSEQYEATLNGHLGRPFDYPVLEQSDLLLFYIQRNHNTNTVVYETNLLPGGLINLEDPIHIYWIKFEKSGAHVIQELNYIQKKLAYGYESKVINNDLIEFSFVSYDKMKLYLRKEENGNFNVATSIDGEMSIIDYIYIYAEDLGVFPQVKYAEFFGKQINTFKSIYKRLYLQQ